MAGSIPAPATENSKTAKSMKANEKKICKETFLAMVPDGRTHVFRFTEPGPYNSGLRHAYRLGAILSNETGNMYRITQNADEGLVMVRVYKPEENARP